jgi:hypothetical protein
LSSMLETSWLTTIFGGSVVIFSGRLTLPWLSILTSSWTSIGPPREQASVSFHV